MEVSDEREAEHDGDDGDEVGVEGGVGKVLKPLFEEAGDDGLADPAEGEAAEGDAELDGGEKFVEVLLKTADGTCSEDFLGDELLDAGFADADEGELGGDKEAVGEDEERYGDGAKEEEAGHGLVASWGWRAWDGGEWCEKLGFRHVLMIIERRWRQVMYIRIRIYWRYSEVHMG